MAKLGRLVPWVVCLLTPWPAFAEEFQGKVVGVADGDTITVLQGTTPVKIRLQAVDCPEKAQPFGTRAKQFTSEMVFGKVVTVKVATRDKYGRTVGWVYGTQCTDGPPRFAPPVPALQHGAVWMMRASTDRVMTRITHATEPGWWEESEAARARPRWAAHLTRRPGAFDRADGSSGRDGYSPM
jgi:micrococcal nuclease